MRVRTENVAARRAVWNEKMASRSRLVSHLSATLIGLVFVFTLSQFPLDSLQGALLDVLYRTMWWRSPVPEIALVGYDDRASERYPDALKFPSEEISAVLARLQFETPRAVILLGPINESIYSDHELSLIAGSLSQFPNSFIGFTDDSSLNRPVPEPIAKIPYLPGIVSKDSFSFGADSVTRRVMVSIDGTPTVFAKAASLVSAEVSRDFASAHSYGRLTDTSQAFIAWQGYPGTYPITSSRNIVERQFVPGQFNNKIVLIGSALSFRKEDHVITPYSRSPKGALALEASAHGLGTLIRDDGLLKPTAFFNFVVAFVLGLITVNLVLYLSPGKGILFVVGEVIAILLVGWVSLFVYHIWLDLAHPLLLSCIGYYLVIPYRLVDEYRKRWHYQEKSELMVQLEQLKSNFLSLISHDLKTPIARIQGSAELILSDPTALPDKPRRWVDSIVNTTQDLSEYVESILDLTRMESSNVSLNKTTKDINSTIREVVASKLPLAGEKNIQIKTELEPLFSFKFDVRLIRRVLANLVENAIKYSPPNTSITLSTKEDNNWIRITVADQGIGVSEEDRTRIFEKFYRADNESTKNTKGSGLGLYLAKYFVELHQGVLGVTSEVGKGSSFTVSLPV